MSNISAPSDTPLQDEDGRATTTPGHDVDESVTEPKPKPQWKIPLLIIAAVYGGGLLISGAISDAAEPGNPQVLEAEIADWAENSSLNPLGVLTFDAECPPFDYTPTYSFLCQLSDSFGNQRVVQVEVLNETGDIRWQLVG